MKDNVSRQIKLVIVLFYRGSGWQTVRLNAVTSKPLRVREQRHLTSWAYAAQGAMRTRTRTLPQITGIIKPAPCTKRQRGWETKAKKYTSVIWVFLFI